MPSSVSPPLQQFSTHSSLQFVLYWWKLLIYCIHQKSLVLPQSTINSRRYSFFVHLTFLCNSVLASILEDCNLKSFRHHLYKARQSRLLVSDHLLKPCCLNFHYCRFDVPRPLICTWFWNTLLLLWFSVGKTCINSSRLDHFSIINNNNYCPPQNLESGWWETRNLLCLP